MGLIPKMRNPPLRFILIILVCLSPLTLVLAQPPDTFDITAFEARLEAAMQAENISGVVVMVVDGDEVIYLQGLGQTPGGDPLDPTAAYPLGRLGDIVLSTLVMIQAEYGLLSPQTPVANLLSDFHLRDDSATAALTVARLLTHSGGLVDDPSRSPLEPYPANESHAFPGERFSYCRACYALLVNLLEQLTQQDLASLLQTFLLEPLRMDQTRLDGYALSSTPADLAHFMSVHLQNGRWRDVQLLKPESIQAIQRPWIPTGGRAVEYMGYGWFVQTQAGLAVKEEADDHLLTARDSFNGAYMTLVPAYGRGILLLPDPANRTPLDPLMEIALETFIGWTPLPIPAPQYPTFFAGTFRSDDITLASIPTITIAIEGDHWLVTINEQIQPAALISERTLGLTLDEQPARLYFDAKGQQVTLTIDGITAVYQRQYNS
jgi:hypothetical protein